MRTFWFLMLVLGLAFSVAIACGDDDDTDSDDDDNDNDDGSGDTDTDSDSDSDSDSDTDSDSDSDCPDCVNNSGFPCQCDATQCDDGSMCGILASGDISGGCFKPCESAADCAAPGYEGCAATGDCVLTDGTSNYCAFTCSGDADCPDGTFCNTVIGIGICYGTP